MIRVALIAGLMTLAACHGGPSDASSEGQSKMAAKAVADVDAANAEAAGKAPASSANGTKSAP